VLLPFLETKKMQTPRSAVSTDCLASSGLQLPKWQTLKEKRTMYSMMSIGSTPGLMTAPVPNRSKLMDECYKLTPKKL